MTIGIIVAMSKELNLLIPQLEGHKETMVQNIAFHCGTIGQHTVVAMQSGIGKVNAAVGTLTLINEFNPKLIINSGVAGGANPKVNVMDIVVGTHIAYHDVYCGPKTIYGAVQGLPLYYRSAPSVVAKVPQEEGIHCGLICTGDRFIESMQEIIDIRGHFPDVLAVDMESGAIAQVCTIREVPFISMRIISDSPGASHNNIRQYQDFWEAAPQHTFEVLTKLISSLQNS
ncbi:MAG: 5'-methylthioadenosine/adenosylhomocysteine nucleosidase [Bacteroidaceae bacterium]|nr:5'-methylthioadenosine/adenosylhomocysteine nucleosidase [Bacteroidaceae bacterium]